MWKEQERAFTDVMQILSSKQFSKTARFKLRNHHGLSFNASIKSLAACMTHEYDLLPRCMECRRGLTMKILSVCPSVKRVHCDKTKRQKDLYRFLHLTKDHLA